MLVHMNYSHHFYMVYIHLYTTSLYKYRPTAAINSNKKYLIFHLKSLSIIITRNNRKQHKSLKFIFANIMKI